MRKWYSLNPVIIEGISAMINISSFIPAMEMVDFQPTSKLGESLVKICQDAIDYKHGLDFSEVEKRSGDDMQTYRILKTAYIADKMYEYAVNTFAQAFRDIVRKEANLNFKECIVYGGGQFRDFSSTAVSVSPNPLSSREFLNRIQRASGAKLPKVLTRDLDEHLLEALDKVATIVDEANTKMLDTKVLTDTLKLDLSATISLDSNSLFCPEILVYDVAEPTAREITAVLLHEIGHVFDQWSRLTETYYVGYQLRQVAEISDSTFVQLFEDIDATQEFVNRRVKVLKTQMIKGGYSPKEVKEVMDEGDSATRILNIARKLKSFAQNNGTQAANESLDFKIAAKAIGVTVISALSILGWYFGRKYLNNLCGFTKYNDALNRHVENVLKGQRTGDKRITSDAQYFAERQADEFVARQGFGSDLATYLSKLTTIGRKMDAQAVFTASKLEATEIEASATFWNKFNPKYYYDKLEHEKVVLRNTHIKEALLSVFQDPKFKQLPREIRRDLVDQVDVIDKAIADSKTYFDSPMAELFSKIARNTNPAEWVEMVKTGNIDKDFAVLQNQLNTINRNPLNYWAEKLKL